MTLAGQILYVKQRTAPQIHGTKILPGQQEIIMSLLHFPAGRRCAIYTRKSVAQAHDQEFRSLEAQRAICSSFIASQRPKGWTEITALSG